MTNAAAPGGANSSCRGGDAPCGSAANPVAGVSACVQNCTYAGGTHAPRLAWTPDRQSTERRGTTVGLCIPVPSAMDYGTHRRHEPCAIASSGGTPGKSLSTPVSRRLVSNSSRRLRTNGAASAITGRRTPRGMSLRSPSIVMTVRAGPNAIALASIVSGIGRPWLPLHVSRARPRIVERATRCIRCAWSTHSPSGAAESHWSSARCVRPPTSNCSGKFVRPWQSPRAH